MENPKLSFRIPKEHHQLVKELIAFYRNLDTETIDQLIEMDVDGNYIKRSFMYGHKRYSNPTLAGHKDQEILSRIAAKELDVNSATISQISRAAATNYKTAKRIKETYGAN